jgi:hypothetical protein
VEKLFTQWLDPMDHRCRLTSKAEQSVQTVNLSPPIHQVDQSALMVKCFQQTPAATSSALFFTVNQKRNCFRLMPQEKLFRKLWVLMPICFLPMIAELA